MEIGKSRITVQRIKGESKENQRNRFLIPVAINNECVAFSIIEIEKLCKESTEFKAEQAYVRNQNPVPMIPIFEKTNKTAAVFFCTVF